MAFADDYVRVNERIDEFLAKYPDGRIQTEIAEHTDSLIVMRATVYRTADDQRPNIAHSQLGIPGKTNFTRDSEIENAETSAVGRALAFMGFLANKGIASREEVESRRDDGPQTLQNRAPATRAPKAGSSPEPEDPAWWPKFKSYAEERCVTFADLDHYMKETATVKSVEGYCHKNNVRPKNLVDAVEDWKEQDKS